jgi:hypothetical protein
MDMTLKQNATIGVLDNLFLDMAECANNAPTNHHTFSDDLDILAEKFIKNFRIDSYYKIFKETDKINQINTLFNGSNIENLIQKSLRYNKPHQGWRQFQTKHYFESDKISPNYYTFALQNDKLLDVWLKGLEHVREKAIKKLEDEIKTFGSENAAQEEAYKAHIASLKALKDAKTQSGGSTKRTTRRPLRRKSSATKRLRRRRRSNRRTSRK